MAAPARKQINIKMPEHLIEALKNKSQAEETTFTDLVIRACEELLGIESSSTAIAISADKIDECIAAKIAPLEERLAVLESRIARSLLSLGR